MRTIIRIGKMATKNDRPTLDIKIYVDKELTLPSALQQK